ncbi:MAG: response regulator transcription factor [Anaerolineae bacterium]|nr:response regulator transcription factor [Anaerolineae bacterium]
MSTWMIVEDEPDLYELLLIMTEALTHEGVAFLNGEEAVHWIDDLDFNRIQAHRPDFALIDIRLPGTIQGDKVCERLRQSPLMGQIPIILMTAYRLSADDEAAMLEKSGANVVIYKPLPDPSELQALFQKLSVPRMTAPPTNGARPSHRGRRHVKGIR